MDNPLIVGASEVPHLFIDPKELFSQREKDDIEKFFCEVGLAVEEVTCRYLESVFQTNLIRQPQRVQEIIPNALYLRATPDALLQVDDIQQPIEIKTCLFGSVIDYYRFYIQVQAQLLVFEAKKGLLVIVSNEGINQHPITASEGLQNEILRRLKVLHENWDVISQHPDLEHFGQYWPKEFRDFYSLPDYTQSDVEEFIALKRKRDHLQKELKDVEQRIRNVRAKLVIQKGEWTIRAPSGFLKKSYFTTKRVNWDLFKTAFPEVYQAVLQEVKYPTLTFYEFRRR